MQIQRTVWHFHRKHDKSQSRTYGQNPQSQPQHTCTWLFLTDIPSQVHETKTLLGLGISDQNIVLYKIKVKWGRIKQNASQVKSYKKANSSDFKKDLAIFTNMVTTHKHKTQTR